MSTSTTRAAGARTPVAQVPGFDDASVQRYREAGLWTEETFGTFIAERTATFADRDAVVGPDARGTEVRLSHAELGLRTRRAAARLGSLGVRPGDRVVVALPNQVEFLEVVLGAFWLGALPVFALPSHRERELSQFAHTADATLLVLAGAGAAALHARTVEAMAALPGEVTPPRLLAIEDWDCVAPSAADEPHYAEPAVTHWSQVAFLQLSGGTTGISKLIPRTHADYLYSVRASAEICDLTPEHRMLVVLPAAHNFAMSSPGILGMLHAGGCVVLAPDPSPRTAFRLIEAERITHAPLVPPLAQAWLSAARRRPEDLSSLQVVQVGGAKLSPTVAAEVGPVLGARLQQVFGMAEGLVCYTRPEDSEDLVRTSQGRPISDHDEIRVVDPEGSDETPVAPGTEGALLTRGPYTIRGYYRLDHRHDEHFTADGFYRTGDLVRQLPSGHLVVTGRAKDQINRGGEKVATEEIEDLLLAHPAVFDALALGLPDPYLGERVVAVVVPEQGVPAPSSAELRAFLAASGLADWKVPEEVHAHPGFPATGVGKNSRRDLRATLTRDLTGVPAGAPAPTTPEGPR